MFKWLFGNRETRRDRLTMNDIDGDYRVVGVSFDNSNGNNRQGLLKQCAPDQEVTLKRKPSKKYPEAIEVWTKFGQIGFIDADDAVNLAKVIDNGTRLIVKIKKITGGNVEKPKLGCIISVQKK